MSASSNAQWVEPDVVVFVREGVLMAQRVDLEAARPLGEPFPIADRVEYFFTTSRAMFSASRHGQRRVPRRWGHRAAGRGPTGTATKVGTIGNPADYDNPLRGCLGTAARCSPRAGRRASGPMTSGGTI